MEGEILPIRSHGSVPFRDWNLPPWSGLRWRSLSARQRIFRRRRAGA